VHPLFVLNELQPFLIAAVSIRKTVICEW